MSIDPNPIPHLTHQRHRPRPALRQPPTPNPQPPNSPTHQRTGAVYESIRGIAAAVGGALAERE